MYFFFLMTTSMSSCAPAWKAHPCPRGLGLPPPPHACAYSCRAGHGHKNTADPSVKVGTASWNPRRTAHGMHACIRSARRGSPLGSAPGAASGSPRRPLRARPPWWRPWTARSPTHPHTCACRTGMCTCVGVCTRVSTCPLAAGVSSSACPGVSTHHITCTHTTNQSSPQGRAA